MIKHRCTGRIPTHQPNKGQLWAGKTAGVETYTRRRERIEAKQERRAQALRKAMAAGVQDGH